MLMELSRRRGVAARTSGQAWPIGWSEPARLFAAAQRLIVLIEGIPNVVQRHDLPRAFGVVPSSLIYDSQS